MNQPSINPPVRLSTHSRFRRDISDHSGNVVTLVITTVILSILLTGVSIYLFKRVWQRIIQPRLEHHRSGSITLSEKLPNLEPYLFTSSKKLDPILPTHRPGLPRSRSYSDALWSAQINHHQDNSSSSDEDQDTPLPRYTSRKSLRYLSVSMSQSAPIFKPLGMNPVQPSDVKRQLSPPRINFAHPSTPTRSSPLSSHPTNNTDSSHRCSGSFDASRSRPKLERRWTSGKAQASQIL